LPDSLIAALAGLAYCCACRTRLLLRLPDWVGILALAGLGGYSNFGFALVPQLT